MLIVGNDKFLAVATLAQRLGERLEDQIDMCIAGN